MRLFLLFSRERPLRTKSILRKPKSSERPGSVNYGRSLLVNDGSSPVSFPSGGRHSQHGLLPTPKGNDVSFHQFDDTNLGLDNQQMSFSSAHNDTRSKRNASARTEQPKLSTEDLYYAGSGPSSGSKREEQGGVLDDAVSLTSPLP